MLKKFFALFETELQYSDFLNSEEFITPNVSLISQLRKLYFNKKQAPNVFKINGQVYSGNGTITLTAGQEYELEGVLEGNIVIDATTSKPSKWTSIRLNGVTILSDQPSGILYNCPESNNKGYQGLYVTLEKDTHNFIICNKENPEENDKTYASIDSWKDLTVQGVGYLAVYNNIGHGLRGETLNIAGPHVYVDVEHDGIHGKTVNVLDGLFYIQHAKDGFGTTDNGKLNIFGGEFEFINVTQDNFDSKQTGIYAIENLTGTNLLGLEDIYEEGTVTAYPTKADYDAKTNGVQINLAIGTTINSGTFYNADENENVVASSTPAGYLTWVWDDPAEVIFDSPQAYLINAEYNIVEVTGKITRPIVRPLDAITLVNPTFSKKGKLNGGYDNKLDIYLNGAVIVTEGNTPSIANLPDVGRIKVTAVKDTINAIINKDATGDGDHDAIKSENNISIELKGGSILYITSNIGDGIDGGETRFIDSKGSFIVTKCGQRGVKGNAIVIGPDAVINSSVIDSYITDPNDPDYVTFDGIFVAKGNVLNHNVGQGIITVEDPEAKQTGFADVYARNGKHTKGMFGTTNNELKGVAIIGSLGAAIRMDEGNAENLYVNTLLGDALNPVETVQETYKAVPYNNDPIPYTNN
jgi:hypothetical protein